MPYSPPEFQGSETDELGFSFSDVGKALSKLASNVVKVVKPVATVAASAIPVGSAVVTGIRTVAAATKSSGAGAARPVTSADVAALSQQVSNKLRADAAAQQARDAGTLGGAFALDQKTLLWGGGALALWLLTGKRRNPRGRRRRSRARRARR